MRTDYCVYTHLRPDDTIFYVGKGVPTRPHRKDGRNSVWVAEVEKHGAHTVNIVKSNLTEKEAFDIEVRLIKRLKDAGVELTNQTRGGDGCKELVFTNEIREKLKVARARQTPPMLGKKASEATKQMLSNIRRGENNPMFGKTHTDETKAKFKKRQAVAYWTGKKMSEEHKAKFKVERACPHCSKVGKGSAMIRWHFDNCKLAVVV